MLSYLLSDNTNFQRTDKLSFLAKGDFLRMKKRRKSSLFGGVYTVRWDAWRQVQKTEEYIGLEKNCGGTGRILGKQRMLQNSRIIVKYARKIKQRRDGKDEQHKTKNC